MRFELTTLQEALTPYLEPLAAYFRSLNLPEFITHWGHPLMMGIVVVFMGSYVGLSGWQGRLSPDPNQAQKSRADHKKLAPFMFLFIVMGYSGGLLSLVMAQHPILESPHFWTGSAAIGILGLNGVISLTKFGGGQAWLRTSHAYIGSAALGLLFVHGVLGLKLGLSF
ncbi:DUF4079 domain-containing protein [Synechococcus sp. PCC 6312]|uniref:DUF4079 domain-containing protein n=1 Tax=Synechococcus sp. (strain ATCC 27167 / PCC 6312) TaxID=195253 RepID=UPI00029F3B1B|nr:DUF4079 domain-containing protein [Synechococcus sp. PCC 6312]AFY62584.1 hypothetical protein Syn6312_3564 [Synechococcus sp. PCC 6312]